MSDHDRLFTIFPEPLMWVKGTTAYLSLSGTSLVPMPRQSMT